MNPIFKRFQRNKTALTGAVIISLYLILALLAPLVAPYDPYHMEYTAILSGPSSSHLLGTDQFGRDIFSRLLYGSRISFQVGIISVSIALSVGTLLGVLAGFYGGWVDLVISRIIEILFTIPDILMALAIMAILGPSINNLMIAIGIVYLPIFARIARGAALDVEGSVFIEAARAMGVKGRTIMIRHLLPNILAPIIVQTTLSLAFAILSEAALSFLGFGVQPDLPSWGIMLNEGKDWMERAWWMSVFPGIAISLAVLSFNLVGDGLRDTLDPRLKNL